MSESSKVIKFKKRKHINIGVVIILFILLYISVYIYHYATKNHLSIYQVQAVNLAEDNIVTGITLREEYEVYADDTGYINYFVSGNSRVAKGELIYSIDENHDIYETISSADLLNKLTADQYDMISDTILKYSSTDTLQEHNKNLASLKNDLEYVLNEIKIENRTTALTSLSSIPDTFDAVSCSESGIISYKTDLYCGLKISDLTPEHFESETYVSENLQTTDIVEQGSVVCRMVSDESWSIVLQLNEEQFFSLKDSPEITVTILKDNFEITVPADFFKIRNSYYARLSLASYMSNYIDDRFLDIELEESLPEGYKIPLTSIAHKNFYLVPEHFLTYGGDTNSKGIVIQTTDSATGLSNYNFVECEIYHTENGYCYIDTNIIGLNTLLYCVATGENFKVNISDDLIGVYNVNKGYASFKRIEILEEGAEYCIVKKNTLNGISLYDHIVLDASTATDSSIIY